MKNNLGAKSTRFILNLVVPIVVLTSFIIGGLSIWSEYSSLSQEFCKRYKLSISSYRNLMTSNSIQNATEVIRNITHNEDVVFAAIILHNENATDNDLIFRMGTAEGGFNHFTTYDLTKLSERPEKQLKNSLKNELLPKDLLNEIKHNRKRKIPNYLTNEEFEIQIPELIAAKMQSFFENNNVIDEQNFSDLQILLRKSFHKTKKDYILKLYNKTEKEQLYDFLYSIDFMKNRISIFPTFKKTKIEKSYLFHCPLYSDSNQEYYGDIIICFSFLYVIKQLQNKIILFIFITLISTLLSIIISIFLAFAFSSTLVKPLREMCSLVKEICKTKDFESLKGTRYEKLNISSGDEIEELAKDINLMTGNLIEKSTSDKQLLLGKEIQEKFIPLTPVKDKNIEIFGFYEGAKGVSGDYFDYKKINDEYYTFIMCDVAGKGVPAALIMVEIFTLFHSLCNKENNTAYMVRQINDILAEKGFTGRFASIIVLSLNIITGEMRFTSAGYSELFIYKHKTARCRKFKLPKIGPAAGVFHSSLLPEPFCEMKSYLDYEDIILLFSDGIEESRNGNFSIDSDNCKHFEEFGQERLINAVDSSMKKTPDGIIRNIIKNERLFRKKAEQYDDLTLLAIMRKR